MLKLRIKHMADKAVAGVTFYVCYLRQQVAEVM